MSDKKYQALYAYALKQQEIISHTGSGFIWRSMVLLAIIAALFAYIGCDGHYPLGLWILCAVCVSDALSTAIKMSDAGY